MKKFRIVRNELSKEGENAFHPLRYRIEQRHCILFGLISWWISPEFAPPHNFETPDEAFNKIIEERWNNVGEVKVISTYRKYIKDLKRN